MHLSHLIREKDERTSKKPTDVPIVDAVSLRYRVILSYHRGRTNKR